MKRNLIALYCCTAVRSAVTGRILSALAFIRMGANSRRSLSKGKGEHLLAAGRQFEIGIPVNIDQAPLDADQSVCVPGPSSP